MHDRKIFLRYLSEMLVTFFLYAVVLVVSIKVGRSLPASIERTLLLFSPILPVLLMIGAGVRYFRRVDEYMRLLILENWAITGVITAVWTFTYGFLENSGFPRLSMFTVFPMMGVTSGFFFIVRRIMDR